MPYGLMHTFGRSTWQLPESLPCDSGWKLAKTKAPHPQYLPYTPNKAHLLCIVSNMKSNQIITVRLLTHSPLQQGSQLPSPLFERILTNFERCGKVVQKMRKQQVCHDWRLLAGKRLAAAGTWCTMYGVGWGHIGCIPWFLGCNWRQKLGWMSVTSQVWQYQVGCYKSSCLSTWNVIGDGVCLA